MRCLVLFEPSLLVGPRVGEARTLLQPAGVAYAAGDLEMAVTAMWDVVAGPHWRDFERIVPGFLERAVADAATLFESDLPSLREWEFGPGQAALVQQPVRYLLGGDTLGLYRDNLALLRSWLPRLDSVEVPRAHHFLQLEHPEQAAELTAAFLTRDTG